MAKNRNHMKRAQITDNRKSAMQKKILLRLLTISICGIVLSTIVFFAIQTFIAQSSADEISLSRLDGVEERMLQNSQQLDGLIDIVREDNLARARALAMLIEVEPSIIEDIDKLNEIAAALKVDEIHIINENGILQWGTQPFKYGMDFANGDQTRPFLAILDDPTIEIAQVPLPNASLGVVRQYAGVSLRHAKGIAEVGVVPERFLEALENARIGNVLSDITVGSTGYIFSVSVETDLISSHPDPDMIGTQLPRKLRDCGEIVVNEQKVRYHTREIQDEIIVTAFPITELYEQRTFSTGFFLIYIVILFILFCIIINLYIKRNVVVGIKEILGTLDAITTGSMDITADVRSNAEFSRLSDGINHMLSSIKSKIAEVSEAKIAAEDASTAKSVFLANMSHEIRTPLNGIIGFSELAIDSAVTPSNKDDYLKKIKISGEGLLQVINDILDISKIEAGKIELENIPFHIHDVFRVCQTIITPKALEKGITLYCYAEPSVGKKLLGDPTRLRQVLLNLLSNAVKFTNTGMVKLVSAIKTSTEDSVTMHFEVKDSGIGMTPEQIKRIFDPFTQADSTTTRKYGGTGLGLSITHNILSLMGSKLLVESTPGVGSKFTFELTFVTVDEADDYHTSEIMVNELKKPTFHGTVLIFEDNEINQQVIRDHLIALGLDTIIACNGKEGVDIVSQRIKYGEAPFDLILMDIHMPVMDGLEAAKKLMDIGCQTPIVAITANIMANDRETYRQHGMPDYIAKPFTTRELWVCLLKYLTPVGIEIINKSDQAEDDTKRRKKLQTDFVRDNRQTFRELIDAIDMGDLTTAHRISHTLKGLAGLMGESALQEAARVIEHSLAEKKAEYTPEQMDKLEFELNAVLEKLLPLLNTPKSKDVAPKHLDRAKAAALFAKLEPLLQSDSVECLELAEELMAIPGTADLIMQMEVYEYEQALEALTAIKKALEI